MSSLIRRALIDLVRFLIYCMVFDCLLGLLNRVFGDRHRTRKLRTVGVYPCQVPALSVSSCTSNEQDICTENGAK